MSRHTSRIHPRCFRSAWFVLKSTRSSMHRQLHVYNGELGIPAIDDAFAVLGPRDLAPDLVPST